jgi:hypothetical protein
VIRAVGEIGLDSRIGTHVLNQLGLLAALVAVFLLARRRGSERAARLAVWAAALFPAAFTFSMTYPSALFLAATAWAFLLVEDGRDLPAGALVAAAALLRPNGLVVAVAAAFALGPLGWRAARRAAVVCGPAVLVLVAWCVYCADRTGDALVWVTVKSRWEEITAFEALTGELKWTLLPHVALGLTAVAVVVAQRQRLPGSWLVLAGLVLLVPLATGMVGLARYAGECFPVLVAGGQVLERLDRRLRAAALAAGAAGLFLFAFAVGRYDLVP